jgi:hypothetical protein
MCQFSGYDWAGPSGQVNLWALTRMGFDSTFLQSPKLTENGSNKPSRFVQLRQWFKLTGKLALHC